MNTYIFEYNFLIKDEPVLSIKDNNAMDRQELNAIMELLAYEHNNQRINYTVQLKEKEG